MPRTGYVFAVALAIIGVFAFSGTAAANHIAGQEPYFSCESSVARASVLNSMLIPTVDPLAANSNKEECAEDLVGLPTIALPPPPAMNPPITATAAQASTEILCATDDPDPAVTPANNDDCDAGRRSFEQQVLSKADAANIHIALPDPVNPTIEIIAQAANTSARAFCGPGNVPSLTSTSNVVNLVVKVGGIVIPITLPPPNEELVVDLGVAKLTLNERVGTEGAKADNSPADELTRRAIHLEVPSGAEPGKGSIADVIVAESVADFHGDVCPEGKIVVKKETAPDESPNTTGFGFTAQPGLDPASSTFTLMDDGSRALRGTAATLTPNEDEVLPGQYTVTENAPTNDYVLTAINCAENRSENTTTSVGTRAAAVNVGPGETVTCTFINAKPPPGICQAGSTPNAQGQCILNTITCPAGSTLNAQGQCISNTTSCPAGSTSQAGQCVSTTITCPTGTQGPNGQGQCLNTTLSCPAGSTQVGNQCVVSRPDCPAGTGRNPQGQCVITSVQCPSGTVFNPTTLGCAEGPSGGTQVPINQIAGFFRASPCIGQGFGPLVGIVGTNGPDRITGSNTSDRIFALGGDDRVSGGRGDDCVEGGAGNDVIDGSNGNDVMIGSTGRDQLNGGPGRDRLEGGTGKDVLSGSNGNDLMRGGAGNDKLNGGYGNDRIYGGPGNDGISNGNGKDVVYGGTGNDTINVAIVAPAAFVDCGPGRDRVRISPGRVGSAKRDRTRNCEFLYIAKRVASRRR